MASSGELGAAGAGAEAGVGAPGLGVADEGGKVVFHILYLIVNGLKIKDNATILAKFYSIYKYR